MFNIKDVAKIAKVSPSTVSRVLNGNTIVSPEKIERVNNAIKELNYTPNSIAQSLRSGKSKTIGLIVPSINNLIYPEIVDGVEDYAKKQGYNVILCNTRENLVDEKKHIQILRDKLVDGLIIASYTKNSSHIDELNKKGCPLVLVLRYKDKTFNTVGLDNIRGGYIATKYLLETGHRHIAFASGTEHICIYNQRFKGYQNALKEFGIELDEKYIIREKNNPEEVYEGVQSLIKSGIILDAIFASNDYRAILVLRALQEMGIDVPSQVSVMGYDDVRIAKFMNPPLTTIHQPFYDIGVRATKQLIMLINNKNIKPMFDLVEEKLIIRDSTKARI